MARRKRKGLPVVLEASSDCPMSATARGDSKACRSAARSFGVISIYFREAKRREGALCKYSGPAETLGDTRRSSLRQVHNNVRIGGIPILRVVAIVARWPLRRPPDLQRGDRC